MKDKEKQINRTDNFGELSDTVSIPNKEKTISVSKFEDIKLTIPCKKELEEKQIKQMASDMDYACTTRDLYPSDAKEIAKTLYLLDYRKVKKDSVILSREDYQKDFNDQFNKGYKHGSEETAVSILSELYYVARFYYGNSANILAWAKDKATKLGVEIKE